MSALSVQARSQQDRRGCGSWEDQTTVSIHCQTGEQRWLFRLRLWLVFQFLPPEGWNDLTLTLVAWEVSGAHPQHWSPHPVGWSGGAGSGWTECGKCCAALQQTGWAGER